MNKILEQAFAEQARALFWLVEAYFENQDMIKAYQSGKGSINGKLTRNLQKADIEKCIGEIRQETKNIADKIKAFSIDVDFSKMFEEITTNLDEPMSEKQRERYCFSLITPFEAFSRVTSPKMVIEWSRESISKLQGLEGAETMIKMCEQQIKEAEEKEQRYFDMAFTAEALATTDEIKCAYRDLAWKINQYANMLDGAFLMYGLDLKRLQNMCGVWVKQDWFNRAFKVSCYVGSERLAEEYIKRLPQEPQKEPQDSDNSNTLIVVPRELQQAAQGQQIGNSEPQQQKTLQDLLPEQLKTDEALKIFQRAIDANLIEKTATGLKWQLSNALLAYLCGIVYCGDTKQWDGYNKEYIVKRGSTFFPDKALSELFGVKNLGQSRLQLKSLPKGYEKVDVLFKG